MIKYIKKISTEEMLPIGDDLSLYERDGGRIHVMYGGDSFWAEGGDYEVLETNITIDDRVYDRIFGKSRATRGKIEMAISGEELTIVATAKTQADWLMLLNQLGELEARLRMIIEGRDGPLERIDGRWR